MRDIFRTSSIILALAFVCSSALLANEKTDYERDIKPLLAEKCVSCHGPVRHESGLRLDAAALIGKGSDNGMVVVSGKPAESGLIKRVTSDSIFLRMPPVDEGHPLTPEQIGHLKRWIAAGMPAPADEVILEGPGDHWAYQPIERPSLPEMDPSVGSDAAVNPIDQILGTKRDAKGLAPMERAEPLTLLRRVTMDLIGLPPTLVEQEAYLADSVPGRYQRLVDRLLASPAYGERWGRHWMDVWRYSDWSGYKTTVRGSQKHIWHWREWIVESLNADKGYDRMIVEMLAGDEIAPLDPKILRATGFLSRSYHSSNRTIWLDATVEHTTKAFLGMTVNCAKCHDHKYDPIAQTDYYQFRAIFEPHNVRMTQIPGRPNDDNNTLTRAYDADLDAPTYLFKRGDERHPDKEHPISPGVVALFDIPFEPKSVELPVLAYAPGLNETVVAEDLAAIRKRLSAATKKFEATRTQPVSTGAVEAAKPTPEGRLAALTLAAVRTELASFEARVAADRAKHGLDDVSKDIREELARKATAAERTHAVAAAEQALYKAELALTKANNAEKQDAKKTKAAEKTRDEAKKTLAEARKALESDKVSYTPVGKQYPKTSTGRRLALARWITHEKNPLTARVAINQIWMRHFGRPLVENVFDFGLQCPKPVHADLLDWLAIELMENDWRMKHIHRLIVNSRTYQLTSATTGESAIHNQAIDPHNTYLWHANARRVEAEIVRDSMLVVGGKLDARQGGPDIDFKKGEEVYRRSIYFRHAYEKQMVMLKLFDAASPNECYQRSASILPQQALVISNSRLAFEMSQSLAARLTSEIGQSEGSNSDYIDALFRTTLCRPPRADELAACLAFLKESAAAEADAVAGTPGSVGEADGTEFVSFSADPGQRSREQLAHVLMNHNDFVTVR